MQQAEGQQDWFREDVNDVYIKRQDCEKSPLIIEQNKRVNEVYIRYYRLLFFIQGSEREEPMAWLEGNYC